MHIAKNSEAMTSSVEGVHNFFCCSCMPVNKGKRKATSEPQDKTKWPPGKYQFYPGCLDPTKSDGTIWRPRKLPERPAKTAKAEGRARAEEREVDAVLEEMVSAVAQYTNARQIDVKIWK